MAIRTTFLGNLVLLGTGLDQLAICGPTIPGDRQDRYGRSFLRCCASDENRTARH